MASKAFYRKWRPQTLADVIGQEQVTKTLLNALAAERVSHAYLFCGPRGTGKTTTGRILAKAVNCLADGKGEPCNQCAMCQAITEGRSLDVIEIDAASNTGVDNIRVLRERAAYSPSEARLKVYIIDEVHMLSTSASNALLKTLEEPPQHVIFILATTESHKVLPTIISRCQRFDFRRILGKDIALKLAKICAEEDIDIGPEALDLIARGAGGSLRDAENLLEQLATYYGAKVDLKQVQEMLGISGDERVKEIARLIISGDASQGIKTINGVDSDGVDLRQFNRELVEYMRALLLIKTGSEEAVDLTAEDIAELKSLADDTTLGRVTQALKALSQVDLTLDNYSTLPLELVLVDLAAGEASAKPIPPQPPQAAPAPPQAKAAPPAKAGKTRDDAVRQAEQAPPPQPAEPAKKAAAANPPEEEVKPLEGGGEIEQLQRNWRQVMENAPEETRRTPTIAILRSAGVKPIAIEGDTVVLAFRYAYHKDQIEKPDNKKIAEKVLAHSLGHACQVRCTFEAKNDHLVKAALKMGAQIIDVEEK